MNIDVDGPLGNTGGQNPVLSIQQSDGIHDGYLSAADFAAFSAKQAALPTGGSTNQYLRGDLTLGTLDTDAVAEAGNLYYTDVRADARITLQKGVANGLATLDGSGKIVSSQLPAIAVTNTYVVGSEAAMLSLGANKGDVAVRTDENKSYIAVDVPTDQVANWQELLTPGSPVQSVNGQTGTVTLTSSNLAEGVNLYYTDARARSALGVSGPLSYNPTTGVFGIGLASGSASGYLSSGDWNTFNSKQSALPAGTSSQYLRGDQTLGTLDTSAVAENGNLYYTQGRFDSALAAKTTDILIEGLTNKYFTDGRADARITLQKGAVNGLATLDGSGKVPTSQLPAMVMNSTYVVADQAGMLALSAVKGDVAVRTDTSESFILSATPASTLGNWQKLLTPTAPVLSVNGQTGAVTLNTGQIGEGGGNLYYTDTRARGALSVSAPLTYNSTTGALGLTMASGSTNGYLTSADWTTFNGKQATITAGTGLSFAGNTLNMTNTGLTFALGTSGTDVNFSSTTVNLGGTTTLNIPNASATARGLVTAGAQTIAGDKTFSGSVAVAKGSDYSTVGTSNDANLGSGSLIRLTGASAQTLTGIAGGTDGRLLTIINAGVYTATLSNDASGSTAANRIKTGTGTDLSLAADASLSLVYDSGASRWRVVGGTGSGGSYTSTDISNKATGGSLGSASTTVDTYSNFNVNQTTAGQTLSIPNPTSVTTTKGKIITISNIGTANFTLGGVTVIAGGAANSFVWDGDSWNAVNAASNVAASYLNATLSANQTTNISTGDHIKFNSVGASTSDDISLDLTSGYTNTANTASLGRFSLKAGKTYRLTANLSGISGPAAVDFDWTWRDANTGTNIGNYVYGDSVSHTQNEIGGSTAEAVYTPASDTRVEIYISTNTNATTVFAANSSATIQVIGGNTPINLVNGVSRRVGEMVYAESGRTVGTGYLAVSPGTITNGAITYPAWAAKHPEFVSGNNIVFPADVAGMFLRNTGGNAAAIGTFQADATAVNGLGGTTSVNGAHSHTVYGYTNKDDMNFTGNGGRMQGSDATTPYDQSTSADGNHSHSLNITSSDVETRPDNRAYQLYTLVDTYTDVAAIGSISMSAISAAVSSSALDNSNYTQTWNWSTLTNGSGLVSNSNALTSGTLHQLATSSTAFTGSLLNLISAGNNGAVTGSLAKFDIVGGSSAAKGLTINNAGTGDAINVSSNGTGLAANFGGAIATRAGTTYTTAGSANDVNFGNASFIRLDTSGAAQIITGIAGGVDGKHLTLSNADASLSVTLSNQSTGSAVANRIITGTGSDVSIAAGASIELIYDATDTRWRVVGGTGGGGNTTLQTISSNSSVSNWNYSVKGDASSTAVTVTLPTAAGNSGKLIEVTRVDSSTNSLCVKAFGSETLNSSTNTVCLYNQYDSIVVRSDGTNVIMVADNRSSAGAPSEYGEATDTSFRSTSSTSFVDATSLSVTLPSAGTYEILYHIDQNAPDPGEGIEFVLTDASNNQVAGSLSRVEMSGSGAYAQQDTNQIVRVTVTSATTYKLRWRSATGAQVDYNWGAEGGVSKITYKKISSPSMVTSTVDYVRATQASNQNPAVGSAIDYTANIQGNIAHVGAGRYRLVAGKTYKLSAAWAPPNNGGANADYQWYNVTAGAYIGTEGSGGDPAGAEYLHGLATAIITPTADTDVEVRYTFDNAGTSGFAKNWMEITQIGTTGTTMGTISTTDYAYAVKTANQAIGSGGGDVAFESKTGSLSMPTTSTFQLIAGKTYKLDTGLWATDGNGQQFEYAWVDAGTNTQLSGTNTGVINEVGSVTNGSSTSLTAGGIYTPVADQTVKVRLTAYSGSNVSIKASTANYEGQSYASVVQLGSTVSTGVAMSYITNALSSGSLDNGNYSQTWNWSTLTTTTGLSLTYNALTSGTGMNISTSSNSLNSSTGLLYINNSGSSTSGNVVRIDASSTKQNALVVAANGNVGIGATGPGSTLTVGGTSNVTGVASFGFSGSSAIDLSVGDSDTGLEQTSDGQLEIRTNGGARFKFNTGNGTSFASYDGDGNIDFGSDARLKHDVEDSGAVLDKVLALKVKNFYYNGKDASNQQYKDIGLIAQEVQPLFPELVGSSYSDALGDNALTVAYTDLGTIGIKAIQELNMKVDQNKVEIDGKTVGGLSNLQTQVNSLTAGLSVVQGKVTDFSDALANVDLRIADLDTRLKVMESASAKSAVSTTTQPSATTVNNTTQQIVESTSQYGVAKVLKGNVDVKVTFKKAYQMVPAVFVTPINNGAIYEVSEVTTAGFTMKLSDSAKADSRFNWMAADLKDAGDDDGTQITAPTPTLPPATVPSNTESSESNGSQNTQ